MATVLSMFLEDGKNGLATFEMTGDMEKPFVVYEETQMGGKKLVRFLALNPQLLKPIPHSPDSQADYFYSGLIVFPKAEEN